MDLPVACPPGQHLGPLINRQRYRAHPDSFWWDHGDCAACRGTITTKDLAPQPAPKPER